MLSPLMKEIIEEALKRKAEIGIVLLNEKQIAIQVSGFYKSDTVNLVDKGKEEGFLIAITRYDQHDEIHNWNDLVELNFEWWDSSKNKFTGWRTPNDVFKQDLIDKGLYSEQFNTSRLYNNNRLERPLTITEEKKGNIYERY